MFVDLRAIGSLALSDKQEQPLEATRKIQAEATKSRFAISSD